MTDILINHIAISQELSACEYLKSFEKEIRKSTTLEVLTRHFTTDNNYYAEKPYLYRRKIKSADKRFESFEIVYDNSETVLAIVFDLKISLSKLEAIFGQALIDNEPYSDTTTFAFKSANPDIDIIKTRYPTWLTKQKDNDFVIDNVGNRLLDPEFSFIQFDIKK